MSNKDGEALSDNKAIEEIVYMCYGTSGTAKDYRERARKVLDRLRRSSDIPGRELMEIAGFNPDSEKERDRFFNFIRKLKGDNKFDLECVRNNNTHDHNPYWFDYGAYASSLSKLKSNAKYTFERSPQAHASTNPSVNDK